MSTHGISGVTRDAEHNYYLPKSLTPYVSVTTVTGQLDKGLQGWVRRRAIEFTIEHLPEAKARINGSAESYANFLESGATRDALREADLGDRVHKTLEQIIGLRLSGGLVNAAPVAVDMQHHVDEFLRFERERRPEWVASEIPFVNVDFGYGGTADALAVIQNELWLIDFKSGRRSYLEHLLQLIAYYEGLRDAYPIERIAVLGLPVGKPYAWKPLPIASADFDAFLRLLENHHWTESRKELFA